MQLLRHLPADEFSQRLARGDLPLRIGPYVYNVQSNLPLVAEGIAALYADFSLAGPEDFVDYNIALRRTGFLQRLRGEAKFLFDEHSPFDPIPTGQAYAFLEWGMNRCVSLHSNEYLKLHAGAVANGDTAIIMPGVPGAGKSTLCAALGLSGWRILSDEHAMILPKTTEIVPLCRPVSLKNESIAVIKSFSSHAKFGPVSEETHKGVVAHMKADLQPDSHDTDTLNVRALIFPRFAKGETQRLSARRRTDSFILAAYHSFNYSLLCEDGFEAMKTLIQNVDCYDLVYHDLDWAVHTVNEQRRLHIRSMNFLLQQIMCCPRDCLNLDNNQLYQLLSQARNTNLMASLAIELESAGVRTQLAHTVNRHFHSAILTHEKQKRDLAYDSENVKVALNSIGENLVLLKGAAYMLAELPVGRGRLITDIDIIVPHGRIDDAERALNEFGWKSSEVDAYDDRYYRKWGHEVPPLTNERRATTLDLHHNILPPTAGPKVDAALLFQNLIEIKPGIFTLSRHDMVIHSATHLFHEGEFHHGLRDLWDLDRMLRDFPSQVPQFWEGLIARARELELQVSLYYGLNYVQQVFRTPIPNGVIDEASKGSAKLRKPVMDFLFERAFRPNKTECRLPFTALALYLLYVRSHYLRMPIYLLLPHLARKAWKRQFGTDNAAEENRENEDV